jgi:hypothetical protein
MRNRLRVALTGRGCAAATVPTVSAGKNETLIQGTGRQCSCSSHVSSSRHQGGAQSSSTWLTCSKCWGQQHASCSGTCCWWGCSPKLCHVLPCTVTLL